MKPTPPSRRTPKRYRPKTYRSRKYKVKKSYKIYGKSVDISKRLGQNTFLPQSMITKTRYVRTFLLNPGINTASTATFRANELFAPEESVPNNGTVSAHQPIGFDQMAQLYLNYKVLSSTITCKVLSENASATTSPMYMSIQKHENASYVPQDISIILERGLSKATPLGASDGSIASCVLTESYNLAKDQPGRRFDSGILGTRVSSINAEDMYFFSIAACPSDGTTDPPIARCLVTIDYTVQWSSPIQIDRS